ncbi:VWA domain-containing protein [Pseudomonas sp.]|uniref:vWA domain-containing protein n=1 Tax=Pseudomonas sp. TaxID=306 RepID=UPI0028AAB142|nr:VWA domain-containing protein [Pseudomonas sp.]
MFEFAWPWIFFLAPLPWVARLILPPTQSQESALKVSFLKELEHLAGHRAHTRLPALKRQLPFVLIWVLLLAATARPQWVGSPLPLPTSGRDILLAVDVSGSMDYPDMTWKGEDISRLTLVKHLIGDFIEGRTGDRIGLILFGSQAYVQAPLTFDRRTVHALLDEALVGIAGKNTAIGDAIGLAVKHLRMRPENSRVMVLITDGANNGGRVDPLIAARLAAEEHVRIYAIGIGADPQQASLSSLFGFSSLDLDEDTLKAIAKETGGRYFRARSQEELSAISNELNSFEPIAQQPTRVRPAKALFYWPLSLALLASLIAAALHIWPKPWRRIPRLRAYAQARGRRQT